MKTTLTGIVAALAAAALVAGCGGGGGESAGAAGGGGGGNNASPVPQGSGSVEAQLGFSAAASPEAQAQVETDIAACMKAQGFEYTPVDPVARQAALTGRSNLSDEDFTRQFGYGIATLYGRGTDQTDPNTRIKQSLSPADQRAYDIALTGGRPEQTYFRASDTGDFSELGGCTKQAADKLFGGAQLLNTLQRALDDLDQTIVQDQRMVRAQEAWRRCMRDKTGQTFEDSEGVELEIQKRLADLVGPLPAGESAPGEFANRTSDRQVDPTALARLKQIEVQYAVADSACEEKRLAPVEEVVTKEKEQQFRDRNAELLRRVKPLGIGK